MLRHELAPAAPEQQLDDIRQQHGIDVRAIQSEVQATLNRQWGLEEADEEASLEAQKYLTVGLGICDYVVGFGTELPNNPKAWPNRCIDIEHLVEDGALTVQDYLQIHGHPFQAEGHSEMFAPIVAAYLPLIKERIATKLRDILIKEEPLLGVVEALGEGEVVPDKLAADALITSVRMQIWQRFQEDPAAAAKWTPASKSFHRQKTAIEDDPPMRSLPASTEHDNQLLELLGQRAAFHESQRNTHSACLASVCWKVSRGMSVIDALVNPLNYYVLEPYWAAEPDVLEVLAMYAGTLTDLDRQSLQQAFSKFASPTAARQTSSATSRSSAPQNMSSRDLIRGANKIDAAATGIQSVGHSDHKSLFEHDGGEVMAGRLLMPKLEGYNFGNPVSEAEESEGSVWFRDATLDKTVVIPGFTSDTVFEGLFVSAADRDPYNIAEVLVDAEKVYIVSSLLREGGLTELPESLEALLATPRVRLDLIVEALETATVYVETIGWGSDRIDLTKLQAYGAVKDGRLQGNCSVSAAIGIEVARILGLKEAQLVAGIPLLEAQGMFPVHAQVVFKENDLGYVFDPTGVAKTSSEVRLNMTRFMTKLSRMGLAVQPSPNMLEVPVDEQPFDTEKFEAAIVKSQEAVLEAALLFTHPQANIYDPRERCFAALASLPDEHALLKLHQELLAARDMIPTALAAKLGQYVSRYDEWVKAAETVSNGTSDAEELIEMLRLEASRKHAIRTLYGGSTANIGILRKIVSELRAEVLQALSPS